MEHRPYTCPPEEVCGCEHLLLQCLECGSEKRGTVDVEKLFCDMGGGKIECGMSDIEEMPLDYSVNEKERQESIKIGLNSLKPSKKENVNYVNDSKNKLRDTDAEKIDIDHTKSRKCQNKTTNMEKTLFKCLNASNEKTPAVQAPCLLENRKEKLTGKTSEQIPLEVEEIHLKFSKDSHLQVQLYNSEQTPMDDLKDKSIINYVPCELQQSPAECSEIPLEDKSKQEQQEFTDAVTKDIKCSTCGEEINGLTYSSENMKDPFKCFIFKGDLKRHIKSVVGNKPVECSECGKRMKCKGELKQHMFTHTREKYECTQCGKQYTQKGTLNRHKLSHVCGKSYKCSKCAKEFTRKSNLEQHMFSHVREDSEEFEYLVNKNTLKQDSTILYINEDSSTDIKTPQEYNFMKHVITIKTEAETDSDCSNFNTESADGSTFTDDDDKKCHSVNNSIEYVNNKGGTEIFIKEEVHLG
ncbi:Zinc finger protein 418-like [Homarus americanus]|uniref:Zinc finger protein 418-like n=1 Tax=Homarus americanus TaxID=6706 RepID=A0A8J5JPA3_HOMAM|nr:Zinc finger protein 418-like [Homarus americanus]